MVDAALKACALTLFAGLFGSLGAYLGLKTRYIGSSHNYAANRRRAIRTGLGAVWVAAALLGLIAFGIFSG